MFLLNPPPQLKDEEAGAVRDANWGMRRDKIEDAQAAKRA